MSTTQTRQIAIVDDDDAIRDALSWLFASRGHQVLTFASAELLLADADPTRFGCLLLDLRMPGLSGQQLFTQLKAQAYCPPVIFLTGHGDVPMAVQALKQGAMDFIEKPFNDNQLVDLVEKALMQDQTLRQQWVMQHQISERLASLTQRETEVMHLILAGKLNKIIADELNISMKTVEVHRARILDKMGVKSAVELASLMKEA
ncbi:response regulator transcription factor [Leeia oryzae]|uniref:response regulator transcription factor n=1 Tax=Leeia oryzae TaxID=356662 RepID=UPI000369723E|nr:response regulator [Leeia oryzae]